MCSVRTVSSAVRRVEDRALSGKVEGVQRINPLVRVWAGMRPGGVENYAR
jgi:hypothetical protein